MALVPELTSQFQREFKIYKPETNFKYGTRGTAKRFHFFFHLAATHTTATARVYGLKDESRVNLAQTKLRLDKS